MNCQIIQNHLSDYLDCEVDAELKRDIREHLFTCNDCNAAYLELQQLKNCLENCELPEYELDALSNLYTRIEAEKRLIVQRPEFIIWTPIYSPPPALVCFLSRLSPGSPSPRITA